MIIIRRLPIVVLLCGASALLLAMIFSLDSRIGQSEFRFLWTAARLLASSANMYDADSVLALQQRETGLTGFNALVSLSPPWAILNITPYALLPFGLATRVWLLTNLFLLIGAAIVLQVQQAGKWAVALAFVFTFGFSITLTALSIGPISILVFAMLAFFLGFEAKRKDLLAGVAFAGMMVKPQMLYITLLLVVLYAVRSRRWGFLIGCALTGVPVFLILLALRPSWPSEYWLGLQQVNAMIWESSTLGGVLLTLTGAPNLKLVGLVAVPLSVWAWWKFGGRVPIRIWIDASVIVSLISAPYGFSYDQVILLAPLLTIGAFISGDLMQTSDKLILSIVLLAADVLSVIERILSPSEVYFAWIPVIVAMAYVYCLWRVPAAFRSATAAAWPLPASTQSLARPTTNN